MLRVAVFVAVSAVFVRLSWRSLRNPRTHGFYRFFAFELLLGLILRNAPVWFHDPLSARQLASWVLATASLGLALEGFRLLRLIGKPAAPEPGSATLPFENTTRLVTVGAYRFIRHPMYASLLALVWSVWLKDPSAMIAVAITTCASALFVAMALVEERENLARFGSEYAAYMKRSRRFVPFVI